ncbi:type VI secretion system protein TssA [Marinobacterium arenosum]|uniref:type VI secretion system protein TssA n=1 Tax=Marinobacterium arenosum TaxID=2862496 RepID=UPI001C973D4C|nr:type VI secretion system ImpA family N-terminal domain-containing protein [Marinobacterium arenosum]MBY4677086.1 type VI secretion system ImpA family N-terminal domain-containing protein [Marinobacterium arenosum]
MEHLLNPVTESAPCGEYLKGNRTLYRGLRNSFNMAQSSFRQLIESPDAISDEALLDANQNNWQELARQCEQTLAETSKDVEVFCWLATAQLFAGSPLANLAAVLETFAEAVERYWADLNPKPPEDKLKADDEAGRKQEWAENRIKPLLQLIGDTQDSGLLYMPLQMIPLVGGIDYSRYFSAEKKGALAELKTEALQAFPAEKAELTETVLSLGRILDSLELLESRIADKCRQDGASGPSFRFVKESIERLIGALRYMVGDSLTPWPLDKVEEAATPAAADVEPDVDGEVAETAAADANPAAQPMAVSGVVSLAASGEIYNRDQAFQELRKIADFFNRTEPHSPVYMLLERAIRWGYMSLPELLNEMVGDNSAVMGRITQLAGLESIDKTEIPAAQISVQELMHKQQAVGSAPLSEPAPPPTPVNGEAAPAVNFPSEPEASSVQQSDASEPGNSDSGSGIASFEW